MGDGEGAKTFGLAISGGVDSMALAALCSGLLNDNNSKMASGPPELAFKAFVVDHAVRRGSNVEAENVSKVLESRGIPTQVLKLNWGMDGRPAELPNFESLARKYRFQTLGKACKEAGINSLFLAHHEDDQAETVMMRLIRGHGVLGLAGMKRASEIPECRGLHGVHESGGLEDLLQDPSRPAWPIFDPSGALPSKTSRTGPAMAIEQGGIRVYRPLLGFSKARLIATCHAENMIWFEDHTNQDPTVTTRNAIRSMFRSHKMPAALSIASMVRLSKTSQVKMEKLESIAAALLRENGVRHFETRAGTIVIRFPHIFKRAVPLELSEERGLIAALILRRVIMLVSPEEHVQLSSLHTAVLNLFPEVHEGGAMRRRSFTVSGVQFSPTEGGTNREWFISRQNYSSMQSKRPIIYVPSGECLKSAGWSTWELYDGRYWIRVQHSGTTSILIRPFHEKDMVGLKTEFQHELRKTLEALLRKYATGNVRWTLPAIVSRFADGKEKVLALPTLNLNLPYHGMELKWEVRYKKVDVGIFVSRPS